jgi:hypothetical protein
MGRFLKKETPIIVENWIASGVKFIAACNVVSYTGLILPLVWPILIADKAAS